jgi:hypothetical protein
MFKRKRRVQINKSGGSKTKQKRRECDGHEMNIVSFGVTPLTPGRGVVRLEGLLTGRFIEKN